MSKVRRRTYRERIADELTAEERAAMLRLQRLTREQASLLNVGTLAAERRLREIAFEKGTLLAIGHDAWQRRLGA